MPSFARSLDRASKPERGRTVTDQTPIAIRTKLSLTDRFEDHVRSRLGRQIGHAAPLIERGTVRFDDINGPKGGVDTICRIKLVLSGRPSVIVAEQGADPEFAFTQAMRSLQTTLERVREKHGLGVGRRERRRARIMRHGESEREELIGRRVGRGPAALERALERPEKRRRDAYVDTAARGVTASDRRAGGSTTARRNTLRKAPRATATLEDSRTRPSRKSTRRSANRGKSSQGKERTAVAASLRPSARATRR
jgi:ribosome-associated translation inhibitor RaiA